MFVNTLQEISIHLKYAYESLLEESNQNSARSRQKTKDIKDAAELDALYSKSEAKNIAEISAKIIKSSIESGDGDGEVIFFIVVECICSFLTSSSWNNTANDQAAMLACLIREHMSRSLPF